MADYNSSLPVRTQNNGDVVVEISDGTTPSQKLAIDSSGRITSKMDDGSGNALTSTTVSAHQALDVNVVAAASIGANGSTAPTSSSEAGALVVSVTPTYSAGNLEPLNMTTAGRLIVDGSQVTQPVSGTVAVTQSTSPWVDNITQIGGSAIALGQTTMSASIPVAIASNQSAVASNITQISGSTPSATNSLAVQITTGSAYISPTNPLPVTIDPAARGTVQNYYTDSSAIAVGSTATQSTTAAGTTGFYAQQVSCTASGKFKAIIQIETGVATNVFNIVAALFNSTATPNAVFRFPSDTLVATGARIQVLMTNNDLSAQDLYSTVSGYQI